MPLNFTMKSWDARPDPSFHRKVTTPFRKLFFVCLVVVLFLLEPIALPLQSKAHEASSLPNVLGRTVRLDALCDDFEDPNWPYEGGLWRGGNPSGRGSPELITRVTTPTGGKTGSTGALEIRTNEIDSDDFPDQEDFLTVEYTPKLGRKLTPADQPVFMVRVWSPPFHQWGDYYRFGFRHEYFLESGSKTYSSIFLEYDKRVGLRPTVVIRIDKNEYVNRRNWVIEQDGWWTLAVAFDEKGVDYYYVYPGLGIPTEKEKIFDGQQIEGRETTLIDYVNYSFFSLMYPPNGNASPPFVIDDYEVWVVKDTKGRF